MCSTFRLALEVLDYAQYEPVLEFTSGRRTVLAIAPAAHTCLRAELLSANTIRRLSGHHVTLKVKQIEFNFTSKDQGWTTENTEGTYNTSSWLEVSIFRPSSRSPGLGGPGLDIDSHGDFQGAENHLMRRGYGEFVHERPASAAVGPQVGEAPLAWYLQGNKVAERNNCDYRVVWAPDHSEGNEGSGTGEGFFETLQEGDSVLVWARAKVSNHFHLLRCPKTINRCLVYG